MSGLARETSVDPEEQQLARWLQVRTNEESGDEFIQPGKRKTLRTVAVVGSVAALVTFIACAVIFSGGARAVHGVDELGEQLFSAIVYGPVSDKIKPKADICNLGTVLDSCIKIKGVAPSYLGGDPFSPKASVTAAEIASLLKVEWASVSDFFTSLGHTDPIGCMDLCTKAAAAFKPNLEMVPQMIDVGCHYPPGDYNSPCVMPVCDVDLSIAVLSKAPYNWTGGVALPATNFTAFNASKSSLRVSVARLFRVYPSPVNTLDFATADIANKSIALPSRSTVGPTDTCDYSNDGKCDEECYCSMGTDCTDCGSCPEGPAASGLKPAPSADEYYSSVLQAHSKALAFLSSALMSIAAGNSPYDPTTTDELKKAISKISNALDSVRYKYPGAIFCTGHLGQVHHSTMHLCHAFMERSVEHQYVDILSIMTEALYGSTSILHMVGRLAMEIVM